MKFAQLYMLHWIWVIIAFGIFLMWAQTYRRKKVERFVQSSLVSVIAKDVNFKRGFYKNILLIAVCMFAMLALLRPQWGFEWREIKREGIDVLVVVDTSKSMLAQDVKPNRLERTKFAVQDLLKKLKGDRIGLIAFAGEAFLVCPLTVDYSGFQITLNDLDVNTIPRGGTDLSKAINEAINDYDDTASKYKAIIIITDGDNLEGEPLKAARLAKEKGIKIYCIGIGSPEGELIQLRDGQGELTFLKDDQGNFIKSRLNEDLLKQIALTTGGIYVKTSGSQFGLDLIYERELSKFEKRDIEAKMEKKYYERFQIPLAIAFILLLWETCLTIRKKK